MYDRGGPCPECGAELLTGREVRGLLGIAEHPKSHPEAAAVFDALYECPDCLRESLRRSEEACRRGETYSLEDVLGELRGGPPARMRKDRGP